MKKTQADDVVLVLSVAGAANIDTMIGRKKDRRNSFRRLLSSADINVLDPASGSALYRWKHLVWRKNPLHEVEELLEILGRLEDKDFLFIRMGQTLEDVEVWGGFLKNPFKVALIREIVMTV